MVEWGNEKLFVVFTQTFWKFVSFFVFELIICNFRQLVDVFHLVSMNDRWNMYMRSTAKEYGMAGSLYRSCKNLICSIIKIRRLDLKCIFTFQSRLRLVGHTNFVGIEWFSTQQSISHRCTDAGFSLHHRYSHGKCSERLSSLVPLILTFYS